jgi:hypothetical protein
MHKTARVTEAALEMLLPRIEAHCATLQRLLHLLAVSTKSACGGDQTESATSTAQPWSTMPTKKTTSSRR